MEKLPPPQGYADKIRWFRLERGFISLDMEITSGLADELVGELEYAEALEHKTITIEITSPGGDVYEAMAMYDAIQQCRARGVKVVGKVIGFAASCASMIVLQACERRQATASARLHLHEISRIVRGAEKKSETEDDLQETKNLHKWGLALLAKRTGKTVEMLDKKISRHEVWFSADEAKEFGLIDEVI